MKSNFMFAVKLRERYSDFPYTLWLHTCTASPLLTPSHKGGAFVTIDEPTLTHHNHSKSMIYITVDS